MAAALVRRCAAKRRCDGEERAVEASADVCRTTVASREVCVFDVVRLGAQLPRKLSLLFPRGLFPRGLRPKRPVA